MMRTAKEGEGAFHQIIGWKAFLFLAMHWTLTYETLESGAVTDSREE